MTLFITPYRTCCNCHHFKYKILANTICKSCCRISIAIARLVIKIATNIVTSMNRNQQQHLNNSRHRHQHNKDLQYHNNSRDYYHQGAAITTMQITHIKNNMPQSHWCNSWSSLFIHCNAILVSLKSQDIPLQQYSNHHFIFLSFAVLQSSFLFPRPSPFIFQLLFL